MALSGGVFSRLYNFVAISESADKVIYPDQVDNELDGMADALSSAIYRDGQSTVTADISLNDHKLTEVADAVDDGDAVPKGQVADLAVALTGDQTVAGVKTFSDNVRVGTFGEGQENPVLDKFNGVSLVGETGAVILNRVDGNAIAAGRGNDGAVMSLFHDGIAVASISVTAAGADYNTTSDRRLKEAIADIDPADVVARFEQLRPVTFRWRPSGRADRGFIADEFEHVYPHLVTGTPDGVEMQQIAAASPAVIADIVAALQDLLRRVSALETAK